MHNVRLIRRPFPRQSGIILRLMLVIVSSALIVGVGLLLLG